jgi:hypothetical protein
MKMTAIEKKNKKNCVIIKKQFLKVATLFKKKLFFSTYCSNDGSLDVT